MPYQHHHNNDSITISNPNFNQFSQTNYQNYYPNNFNPYFTNSNQHIKSSQMYNSPGIMNIKNEKMLLHPKKLNQIPEVINSQNEDENLYEDLKGIGNYPEEWINELPDNNNNLNSMNLTAGQYGMYIPSPNIPIEINGMYSNNYIDNNIMNSNYNQYNPHNLTQQSALYNNSMGFNGHNDSNNFKGQSQVFLNEFSPHSFSNRMTEDCLYMNLEEEYLHKISMHSKDKKNKRK